MRTLASYAAYYERWSKVWEAQALLRAEPIAGDARARRRVHRRWSTRCAIPQAGLSDADVAEVRRIKARVDAERLPRGADPATHLKLGRGGLADVEWTVQLLQMRYAGQHPALRTTQTIEALDAAVAAGLLIERVRRDAAAARRGGSRAGSATRRCSCAGGRRTRSRPARATASAWRSCAATTATRRAGSTTTTCGSPGGRARRSTRFLELSRPTSAGESALGP